MSVTQQDIFWDWGAACDRDVEAQKQLARYVLEELDEVAKIFHEAKQDLKRLTGDPSFYGYISRDPDRIRLEVRALFERLQREHPRAGGKDLVYVLEPIESVRAGHKQRVRLAREVLFWGHGVCLDWVLLFAACIFRAHIYPLIVVTKGHAILGYWLAEDDARRSGRVILSGEEVARLFNGQRIKVINATRIPVAENGELMPFEDAEEEAETHLPYALFAVDLWKARAEGVNPLLPLEPYHAHSLQSTDIFQLRPELKMVHNWWRGENFYGVLALVGPGGVGKTTIAHRFLEELPGSGIDTIDVAKHEDLPTPDALFVWSFEKEPNVLQFITGLYHYLTGEWEEDVAISYRKLKDTLSNWMGRRLLLVLDGLEVLQRMPEKKREKGFFGMLIDTEGILLANLLAWAADGRRAIRVLLTSRFDLTDLLGSKGYRVVEVGELPLDSARALLSARGVNGDNDQLNGLIQKFGNHALTLDQLAGALVEYFNGDPRGVLEIEKQVPSLIEIKGTAKLEKQAYHLWRILSFYMHQIEPKEKATLRRLSLFQEPVEAELLTAIFLGDDNEHAVGPFAATQPFQIKQCLHSLADKYRLVYRDSGSGQFAVRPLVRELVKIMPFEIDKPEYLLRPLIEYLRKHPAAHHVWRALCSVRGESFLPLLRDLLETSSSIGKAAVACALSEIGRPEDAFKILRAQPREINENTVTPSGFFQYAFKLAGDSLSLQTVLLLLLHLDLAILGYYNFLLRVFSDMPYEVQREAEVRLFRMGRKALPYLRKILEFSDAELSGMVKGTLISVTGGMGAFISFLPSIIKQMRFNCLRMIFEIGGQDTFDELLGDIPDLALKDIEDAYKYEFCLDLAWKMTGKATKLPFQTLRVVHMAELLFGIPSRTPIQWLRELKSKIKTTKTVKQCNLAFTPWHSQTPFGVAKADVPVVFLSMEVPVSSKQLSKTCGFEFASPLLPRVIFRTVLSQEPLNLANDEDRAIIIPIQTLDGSMVPYHQMTYKRHTIGSYHGTRILIGLYSEYNLAIIFVTRIDGTTVTFSLLMDVPPFEFRQVTDVGIEEWLFQDSKVKWYNAIFESYIMSFQLMKK